MFWSPPPSEWKARVRWNKIFIWLHIHRTEVSVQFLADGGEHRLPVLPSRLQRASPALLLTPASKVLGCTCPACLCSMAQEFRCHALINHLHCFWVGAGWCQAHNTGRQSWLAGCTATCSNNDGRLLQVWKWYLQAQGKLLSSVIRPLCLALAESIWSTRSTLGLPRKRNQQSGMSQEGDMLGAGAPGMWGDAGDLGLFAIFCYVKSHCK